MRRNVPDRIFNPSRSLPVRSANNEPTHPTRGAMVWVEFLKFAVVLVVLLVRSLYLSARVCVCVVRYSRIVWK